MIRATGSSGSDHDSPSNDISPDISPHGKFLDQDCGGVFPDEVSHIENAGYPGILIPHEILYRRVNDQRSRLDFIRDE